MGNHGSYRRLCRSERLSLLNVYGLIGAVENLAITWGKKNKISEQEIKYYAEGLTKIWQAIRIFEKRLEPEVVERLQIEISNATNIMLPIPEVLELQKKMLEENAHICINRALLDTLTEKALYWCNPCEVKDCKTCELREALIAIKAEPFNYDVDGGCEFQFKKKFKKGFSSVEDFVDYCDKMHFEPSQNLIKQFEILLRHHRDYYESVNIPEKVVRKFMRRLAPTLFQD